MEIFIYVDYGLFSKVFHTYCYESSISSIAVIKSIDLLHTYFSLFILHLLALFLWVTASTLTNITHRERRLMIFCQLAYFMRRYWIDTSIVRDARIGGGWGLLPSPPVFGRSVNPIITRGSKIMPITLLPAPGFLDGAASLLFLHPKCKLQNWSHTSNTVRYELQSL